MVKPKPMVSESSGVPSVHRNRDWKAWSQSSTSSNIADVIEHFLLSLRTQATRKAYARNLLELLNFCQEKLGFTVTDISEITEKLLLLWQEQLEYQHQKNTRITAHEQKGRVVTTTVARKLSAASSLLEFSFKRGLIPKNPAQLLTRPRIKRQSRTNALNTDEVSALLQACRHAHEQAQANPATSARTKASAHLRFAVLHTLFTVGMRVDELCLLRLQDLEKGATSLGMARLHMVTKGGESHSPIIAAHTLKVIEDYVACYRSHAPAAEPLFVRAQTTSRLTSLTQSAVYQMIVGMAREMGLSKHISPHSARATVATQLHRVGVPLGDIQDLLNHKQIQTTALYIKKSDEESDSVTSKLPYLNPRT